MTKSSALVAKVDLTLIVKQTGIPQKRLERLMNKYDFSPADLPGVIEIMKDFSAKEQTIAKFANDERLSISEIRTLYLTRNNIQDSLLDCDGGISLSVILRTHRFFSDCNLDEEVLSEKILYAHRVIEGPFLGTSLDTAIKTAEDLGIDSIEAVTEYFESGGLSVWEQGSNSLAALLKDDRTFVLDGRRK